ncbi:MAG: homoserine dehydrogenase, partial [Pseudomonadota bacterium]
MSSQLAKLEDEGRPIRIGLVGTGEMGTDIFTQVAMMKGVEIATVMERSPGKAAAGAHLAYGEHGHVIEANSHDAISTAVEAGKIAATTDLDLALSHDLVDVVI